MSSAVAVKVSYGDGISLTLKNNCFVKSMLIAWGGVIGETQEPIKIEFTSTGKVLYAHKETFMAFLQKDISLEQLIESTQCDDVYRNIQEINYLDTIIDSRQLWKKIKNRIFLIDEDNSIDIPFEEKYFLRVE